MIEAAASQSPVGSIVFAVTALFCISVVVLLILRHYLPLRTTPAYLLVPIFFALWLPASMVLLVPIDLASSSMVEDVNSRGIWLEPGTLKVSWRITYWLTFGLTWFILPILAEYCDSGYREPKGKILDSLRANAQYYAILFGSGAIGLIYVYWSYGQFSESLKGTIMALAYCWGLVLAIYLMGHGLVAIPRRLISNANISGRLRRIQSHAPKVYEQMEDAQMNLEDLEMLVGELSRRGGGSASQFRDWIEELVDLTNLPEGMIPQSHAIRPRGTGDDSNRTLPTVITEKYMAELTRKLVRARHARSRYTNAWNNLLQDAVRTQAILDSTASKRLDFGGPSPGSGGFWDKHTMFTPYTRFLYHYYFVPYLRIGFGALLAIASVCIVWSEVVKGLFPSLSVIRYSVAHHQLADGKSQVGPAGQAIAAFWMLYMCAAALITITEVKVWRGRALVRRNTGHESAFWYANQVARLSVPLSYNFMTFLGGVYKDTVFYSFLGQLIDLTKLGERFDYLFPAFILFPVAATLFGLYGKVGRIFGFGADVIEDDDEEDTGRWGSYGTGSWREGRDLIERELNGTSASIRGRRAGGPGRRYHDSDSPAGRRAPIMTVPKTSSSSRPAGGGARGGPATPLGTSPNTRPVANTSARRSGGGPRNVMLDEPDDDENFLEMIGHRFKNTMDTFETPRWFQDIKKPKWMGGDGGDDDVRGPRASASSSRPSAGRANSDVRRWFGGGGGEGRVRL